MCRVYPDGGGSYDDVIKGYERYASVRKRPAEVIQTSILHGRKLRESVQHLWELGSDTIIANPTLPVHLSPEKFSFNRSDQTEFLRQFTEVCEIMVEKLCKNERKSIHLPFIYLERLHNRIPVPPGCGAGHTPSISADGKIYPCQSLVNHEEYQLGDVDSGLNIKALKRFYPLFLNYLQKCNTCWARNLCGSACIAQAIWNNELSEEYDASRYCDMYRKTTAILMDMYNLIGERDYKLTDKLFSPHPSKESLKFRHEKSKQTK